MERLHYTVDEKTEIIENNISDSANARKIAEATGCFTFVMLNDLIKALQKIRKGK
jgi:hypothetical protein